MYSPLWLSGGILDCQARDPGSIPALAAVKVYAVRFSELAASFSYIQKTSPLSPSLGRADCAVQGMTKRTVTSSVQRARLTHRRKEKRVC